MRLTNFDNIIDMVFGYGAVGAPRGITVAWGLTRPQSGHVPIVGYMSPKYRQESTYRLMLHLTCSSQSSPLLSSSLDMQ